MKNFLPVKIMGITKSNWVSASKSFPLSPIKALGNGAWNIPPIPKYIRGIKNIKEITALFLSSSEKSSTTPVELTLPALFSFLRTFAP